MSTSSTSTTPLPPNHWTNTMVEEIEKICQAYKSGSVTSEELKTELKTELSKFCQNYFQGNNNLPSNSDVHTAHNYHTENVVIFLCVIACLCVALAVIQMILQSGILNHLSDEHCKLITRCASIYLLMFGSPFDPFPNLLSNRIVMVTYAIFVLASMKGWSEEGTMFEVMSTSDFNTLVVLVFYTFASYYRDSYCVGFMSVFMLHHFLNYSDFCGFWLYDGSRAMKESMLFRSTVFSGVLLLFGLSLTKSLMVFKYGLVFINTFSYFFGLLLLTNPFAKANDFQILTNGIALLSGIIAVWAGNMYDLSPLAGVGGSFFAIYITEMFAVCVYKNVVNVHLSIFYMAMYLFGIAYVLHKYS
jgi:hypothetical protein